MSGPEDDPSRLDDHTYFRAVEDLFLALRARATLVPPGDYRIARRWNELGIPVSLIERVVAEVLAKRQARGNTDPIGFRYVRRWVERAWDAEQQLQAPAAPVPMPGVDVTTRLARLAEALPAGLAGRQDWKRRIEALDGPDPEVVERALTGLDSELLHAVLSGQTADDREAFDRSLARAIGRLAERLPDAELARASDALREQRLRSHHGLPVLSLFAPEAEGSLAPDLDDR